MFAKKFQVVHNENLTNCRIVTKKEKSNWILETIKPPFILEPNVIIEKYEFYFSACYLQCIDCLNVFEIRLGIHSSKLNTNLVKMYKDYDIVEDQIHLFVCCKNCQNGFLSCFPLYWFKSLLVLFHLSIYPILKVNCYYEIHFDNVKDRNILWTSFNVKYDDEATNRIIQKESTKFYEFCTCQENSKEENKNHFSLALQNVSIQNFKLLYFYVKKSSELFVYTNLNNFNTNGFNIQNMEINSISELITHWKMHLKYTLFDHFIYILKQPITQ